MTDMVSMTRQEKNRLEERARKSSMDKSHLQLIISLMNKMSEVPGLDNVIGNMLRSVVEVIGGTNMMLYYWIDDGLFCMDLLGSQRKLERIEDPLVLQAFESRTPVEKVHEFADTQMKTPEFGNAYTWVFPLLVHSELIGIFKIENLHIGMRELYQQLPTFFGYAALVLKNEILGYTQLKKAFENLSIEVEARKQAEDELRKSKAELEVRVEERTAELSITNKRLSQDIIERKRAEKALRTNELNLETLFNAINESVGLIENDGTLIAANKTFAARLNRQVKDCVGKCVYDLIPADVAARRRPILERVVQTGQAITFDDERQGRWIRQSICPALNPEGITERIAIYAMDVTDQRLIEDTRTFLLQCGLPTTGEDFFVSLARFIAEKLAMEYVCIDRLEDDLLWARTVAIYHDGAFDDNVRYALKDTPCGAVVDSRVCCFTQSVCKEFPHDLALQDLNAESYVGTVLWSSKGAPVGLIAVIGRTPLEDPERAKTLLNLVAPRAAAELERRQAEASIADNESRLRRISSMISDIAYSCTADDKGRYSINWMMGATEQVTGYSIDEIKAMGCWGNLVVDEDRPLFNERVVGLGIGEQGLCEIRLRDKSGNLVWISSHAECVKDPEGPSGTLLYGALIDITARAQAEEEKNRLETQLLQAQKMESVGRLAGGVAHDFNNMLQAILTNVDLTIGETPPDSPVLESLNEIRTCAEHSAALTRQLLAFARKQTVSPKVLDLNDTVTGTLKMLQRLLGERIVLRWRPAAGLWPIKMDPSQIDQMLANLCVNARDAIVDIGEITIETGNHAMDEAYCSMHVGFTPGDYVRLVVSDTGSGMDRDTLAHIFEPFFTTKGLGEGTGLGLATVYGVVKQNRGFINVYSEPGHGTVFTIYLPRHVGKGEQAQAPAPMEAVSQGQETILLVEDEPTILRLTAKMLARQGYTVLAASSPGEAIHQAETYPGDIHLLMTDVIMPEMNGRDLAKSLLRIYPGIKRLFMSGYTADVIAHHGMLDPGIHFIQKPFAMKDLMVKIREAFADK